MNKNPKMTSSRLEELIELNIIRREVLSDKYRTVEYSLTDKGREIEALLEQILEINQKE